MAKRDRDTGIWKDPFYRALPPLYKCFWDFLNDDCDNSGVWCVDFSWAKICIGKKIDPDKALELFGDRVQVFDSGNKWHVKTFVSEKLGFTQLNPVHKFQKSIMDLLIKHKIDSIKGYPDTLQSVKERIKDKGKDKGGEGQGSGEPTFVYEAAAENQKPITMPSTKHEITSEILNDERFMEGLQITHKGKDIPQAWEECWLHHSQPDIPPWDVGKWKQKLNGWLSNKKVSNGKGKGITAQGTLDRLNSYN